jgi:F0F1-type ATP synthase delta subunit
VKGRGVDLSFKVDPDILDGLSLSAGCRVIDGSAVGQLERFRESLV